VSQGKKHKLYSQTSSECKIPLTVLRNHNKKFMNAAKIAIVSWPNLKICWPVTMYLLYLVSLNRSLKGSGGTILTYAKQLSHFVRFFVEHKLSFCDIDDRDITLFVDDLKDERCIDTKGCNRAKRHSNQVRTIASRALHFLFWYQNKFLHDTGLIGYEGDNCLITVYHQTFYINGVTVTSMSHASFPTADVVKPQNPVSSIQIEELFLANLESPQCVYVKRRRATMLNLARATGGRRIEMSAVTITEIREACNSGFLNLLVAKKRKRVVRPIPILKSRLNQIIQFIDGPRTKLLKDLGKQNDDSGHLFLSTKGNKLSENTLTNDMNDISHMASLAVNVCLHMFRHRYFTDMAYNLLLGIKEFVEKRELTAPSERIVLQEMRSLSEHESDESLLRYIHAAYKEAPAWDLGERLCGTYHKLMKQ